MVTEDVKVEEAGEVGLSIEQLKTQLELERLSNAALTADRDKYKKLAKKRRETLKALNSQLDNQKRKIQSLTSRCENLEAREVRAGEGS